MLRRASILPILSVDLPFSGAQQGGFTPARRSRSIMKQPNNRDEVHQLNLGHADELRCVASGSSEAFCRQCEACQLNFVLSHVRQWVSRAGDQSKRRFVLGLIRRLRSVDLLRHVIQMLQPLSSKDSVYARTRLKPSLSTDLITAGSDRSLIVSKWETIMVEVFAWFQSRNYWTKSNFLLTILRLCDAHLLQNVASLSRSLLTQESRKKSPVLRRRTSGKKSKETPPEPPLKDIPLSAYYEEPFPEVNKFLRSIRIDPESPASPDDDIRPPDADSDEEWIEEWEAEIVNDETDDEEEKDLVDMVLGGGSKSYSGVIGRVDFIRHLPIHLSKYILNLLDEKSLKRALHVTSHWRRVAEEVLREVIINQQVREEVMLMQGASANAVNPVYAQDVDVLVPNVRPGSFDIVYDSLEIAEKITKVTKNNLFKTECNFTNGYAGVSTRKVIMEERNVYCGGYNVLVLKSKEDGQRVLHTDGSRLIAVGSADRKVRFVDIENGHDVGPVIHGHAGSIKSIFLCSRRGFVLSGSYDTSIRRWDIHTATCQKIYRGHMGSIIALAVHKEMFATGAMDNLCKVWRFEQRKSIRTLKHRHPVTAVAIGDNLVVSGDQKGKVKVWSLSDGKLVKYLKGHSDEISAIKFDKWHIVTASKDGYALVWSAVGYHATCLAALRHPKAVLSVEFQYLRVITGSEDGRLRIWNILTGQCCRIMRGNSRSDPIKQINTIDNRITVNTAGNILALNFEPIQWNYTLADDKVAPLIQYGHFRDAPVRQQPYPYVRAQRMRLAGSADPRVLRQEPRTADLTGTGDTDMQDGRWTVMTQLMQSRVRSAARQSLRPRSGATSASSGQGRRMNVRWKEEKEEAEVVAHEIYEDVPETDGKSSPGLTGVDELQVPGRKRRISWSFEHPVIPPGTTQMDLVGMKTLLKSQLRTLPEAAVKPEFISLTVNALQTSYAAREETQRTENMTLTLDSLEEREGQEVGEETEEDEEDVGSPGRPRRRTRPSSSPSRIDPRTKIHVEDSDWRSLLRDEKVEEDQEGEISERPTTAASTQLPQGYPITPSRQVITTSYVDVTVTRDTSRSRHSKTTRTTIPRSHILRPHSASGIGNRTETRAPSARPLSANTTFGRPRSAQTRSQFSGHSELSIISDGGKTLFSSSAANATQHMTPMLMYPKGMLDSLRNRKENLSLRLRNLAAVNQTNPFKDPFRNKSDFRLRTYEQDVQHIKDVEDMFENQRQLADEFDEKERKKRWLEVVKKPRPKTAS